MSIPPLKGARPMKLPKIVLDDLCRSGLDASDAEVMGVEYRPEFDPEPGKSKLGSAIRLRAYLIPYHGLDGKPTGFYRARLLDPWTPKTAKRPAKYWQPPGTQPSLYFPRASGLDWRAIAKDSSVPITMVEGEKKAQALAKIGVAAIGLGGVWSWLTRETEEAPSDPIAALNLLNWGPRMTARRVAVCFDSDEAFKPSVQAAKAALVKQLVARGANPHEILLPNLPGREKVGADDFLVHNRKRAREAWDALPRASLFMPETRTGADLLACELPPQRWVVAGLVAPGLMFVAGPPKAGKSWLVLALVIAVATGTPFLTAATKASEVLYIALEDTDRRLQDRIRRLAPAGVKLDRLHLVTRWPSAEAGGLAALERWLEEHPGCRLVAIDTLGKFRAATSAKVGDIYLHDYQEMGRLKAIADRHNIALVLVHHLRKAEAGDVFERISGSTGITGAADTSAVLLREHNGEVGFLAFTGRDLETTEDLALGFDAGVWTLKGRASEYRASEGQRAVLAALRSAGRSLTATEVSRMLDKGRGSAFKWLTALEELGLIERTADERYVPKKGIGNGNE